MRAISRGAAVSCVARRVARGATRCFAAAASEEVDEEEEWVRVKHNVVLSGEEKVLSPTFIDMPKQCTVIGAPMTYGQPLAGTDGGPELIRQCGLRESLTQLDWRVNDIGDLKFETPKGSDPTLPKALGKARNCYAVGKSMEILSQATCEAAQSGAFPLTIGGDHSIASGSLSGVLKARPNTKVLWVDAHADINTPASSPSGNLHGMPISLLTRIVQPNTMPGWEWMEDTPRLDPQDIVYIGLRDVDAGEVELIRDLGIAAFTMQHIDRFGIGGVMRRALEIVGKDCPIHLSLDIDAVDPVEVSSFMYRYILRESCSQFDSLPLTSLT
jgi:arginase